MKTFKELLTESKLPSGSFDRIKFTPGRVMAGKSPLSDAGVERKIWEFIEDQEHITVSDFNLLKASSAGSQYEIITMFDFPSKDWDRFFKSLERLLKTTITIDKY